MVLMFALYAVLEKCVEFFPSGALVKLLIHKY
jgi:hypothetical protein